MEIQDSSKAVPPPPDRREEPGGGAPAGRLDSWKEVAAYLNRAIRTVQRWEREQGLPVHRLRHEKRGSVYARREELDAWWDSRKMDLESEPPAGEAAGQSIAVLPFADMSQARDQEYFCDGIAEEIIGALSRVAGLRVASRTSSFRFKDRAVDARELGARLGVRNLLEGSVRKSEDRLRITVQLTEAEGGYQLWAAHYDREMQDIFAIQEEIANQVAEALEITLSNQEQAVLRRTPTREVRAYDYYLRGRKFYAGYGPQDIEFARQLFHRATETDPNYALAWAGLADCWSYTYLHGERSAEVREQAETASLRGVELDPECAQARASRGVVLALTGRDAVPEFERAVSLGPNLFEAWYFYARYSFTRGEFEKAVRLYGEAMRVNPEDYQSPLLVAQIHEDLGRPDKARHCRETGIRLAEQSLDLNPDDARAVYMAANGLVALGELERGQQMAARALAMRPEDAMLLYNVGCIYSLVGRPEEAIVCLEKACDKGLTYVGWYEHDSNLAPLRGNPRFEQLLRRMR